MEIQAEYNEELKEFLEYLKSNNVKHDGILGTSNPIDVDQEVLATKYHKNIIIFDKKELKTNKFDEFIKKNMYGK